MAEDVDDGLDWEDPEHPYDDEPSKPFWRCEECGHESHTRPMPPDRDKYYLRRETIGAHKCPRCKSEAFIPIGF